MNATTRAALVGALWLAGVAGVPAAEPIPPGQYDKLRERIKPADGEDAWAKVPWLTSLWEAREKAARLGKPILLWEMDGNPLGCT
jgi:hypothetical protein